MPRGKWLRILSRSSYGLRRHGRLHAAQIIEIRGGGASFDAKLDTIIAIGDKTVTDLLHGTTRVPVDFPAARAL